MRSFSTICLTTLIGLFFIPLKGSALPELMRIGLFYGERTRSVDLFIHDGPYRVSLDGERIRRLEADEGLRVKYLDSAEMKVSTPEGRSMRGHTLRVTPLVEEASFKLKKSDPYPVDRRYPGGLTIEALSHKIQPINRVDMDRYLSGVVLAEAGQGHHQEFYKVQAVICRTYALHNLKKFRDRGFHLCDKVACQVYRGLNTVEPRIDSAVEATNGLVLVDENVELITAAYHSNSGGRTAASETAWSEALSYLRSIEDPFSKGGRHYRWKQVLPKQEWLNYLERDHGYPVDSTWYRQHATSYCPEGRKVHFDPFGDSIPLNEIRRDLGLRSTYFRIRCKEDSVVFEGKGFGHGVGLSQEGAMRMADLGVPYDEIIDFYYQDVHLVKIEALDILREDDP